MDAEDGERARSMDTSSSSDYDSGSSGEGADPDDEPLLSYYGR